MSFMKTPVGDCHYHAILTKWCRLQKLVIPIMEQMPAIIKEVRYEALLKDKQAVLAGLYEFIGARHSGNLLQLGSVLAMESQEQQTEKAKGRRGGPEGGGALLPVPEPRARPVLLRGTDGQVDPIICV